AFAAKLARLSSGAPLATSAPDGERAVAALAFCQQSPLLDLFSSAAESYVSGNAGMVAEMHSWNWQAGPNVGMANAVLTNGIFSSAIAAAKQDPLYTTVLAGINVESGFIVGTTFGYGAAFDMLDRTPPAGLAFELLSIGLAVNLSLNLQVGAFDPRIV